MSSDLPWSTLIDDEPSVAQSGSSNPMMYFGEVVIALKAKNLVASCLSLLDPPPHNIGIPTIPDGGEGVGDQSKGKLDLMRIKRWTYHSTSQVCP
jgi:hypothetical protein